MKKNKLDSIRIGKFVFLTSLSFILLIIFTVILSLQLSGYLRFLTLPVYLIFFFIEHQLYKATKDFPVIQKVNKAYVDFFSAFLLSNTIFVIVGDQAPVYIYHFSFSIWYLAKIYTDPAYKRMRYKKGDLYYYTKNAFWLFFFPEFFIPLAIIFPFLDNEIKKDTKNL